MIRFVLGLLSVLSAFLSTTVTPTVASAQQNMIGTPYQALPPAAALEQFRQTARQIEITAIRVAATQQGGRVKPLDTLARETLLFLNGKKHRWGLEPVQEYLGLIVSAASPWLELIEIREPEVRVQLGFLKERRFVSVAELEATDIETRVAPLQQKQQANARSVSAVEKSWLELFNQLSLARSVITGDHLVGSIDFSHLEAGAGTNTISQTQNKIVEYLKTVATNPTAASPLAAALVDWSRTQKTPDLFQHALKKLEIEVFYNDARIFLWTAVLYFLLSIVLFVPRLRTHVSPRATVALFLVPLALQISGLALRVYLTRFAPITNMYGTMIWVSLGVNLFSLVLYLLYRNSFISACMLVVSGLILILTESFPLVLSPDLDPIVAVLRNNFWLSTHVTTITISYAAFTIAMIVGNIALVRRLLGHPMESFVKEYARHAYRAIQLGCFLLTVGIILGGIWADYSWGRFWGWDPKETWALIADLGFLALLHARYAGWTKEFLFLALSPIAYLMVIMAWYGVNFILAAGLHSYGFSSGGAIAVVVFVSLQLLLLVVALLRTPGRSAVAAPARG